MDSHIRALMLLAAVALVAAGTVGAQQVDEAIDEGLERTQQARDAQRRIDELSDDIEERIAAYRAIDDEIEGLEVYVAQLERQIADQEDELGDLDRSIESVTLIERQITPLMLNMIDALGQFVELDVPFLIEQRRERVAELRALIDRADVTVAEKYRNVLEAYLEEIEYGQTLEAYSGEIELAGQLQEVDFLRVGRIALVYQSLDGERIGLWDQSAGAWTTLAASHRGQIEAAFRIAREQQAPDLVRLPIPTAGD